MACAYLGISHRLPSIYLTKGNFEQKNCNGQTPLHLAACRGNLEKIPREFLTLKNLLRVDNYGDDPLKAAARKSSLGSVPSVNLKLDFVPELSMGAWQVLPKERRAILLEILSGIAVEIPLHMTVNWDHLQPSGTWAGL